LIRNEKKHYSHSTSHSTVEELFRLGAVHCNSEDKGDSLKITNYEKQLIEMYDPSLMDQISWPENARPESETMDDVSYFQLSQQGQWNKVNTRISTEIKWKKAQPQHAAESIMLNTVTTHHCNDVQARQLLFIENLSLFLNKKLRKLYMHLKQTV